MRSRTASDLPGRCKRCYLKEALCLCSEVPRLDVRARVVLVRHVLEGFKSTNTGRMALLALPDSSVLAYDGPSEALDKRLAALERPWLLFPGGSPSVPTGDLPTHLVVLDGTWRQARRMSKRIAPLAAMPRLSLAPNASSVRRLRRSPLPEGVSTIEAIAEAMGVLDGDAARRALLGLHDKMVERVLVGRGKTSPAPTAK